MGRKQTLSKHAQIVEEMAELKLRGIESRAEIEFPIPGEKDAEMDAAIRGLEKRRDGRSHPKPRPVRPSLTLSIHPMTAKIIFLLDKRWNLARGRVIDRVIQAASASLEKMDPAWKKRMDQERETWSEEIGDDEIYKIGGPHDWLADDEYWDRIDKQYEERAKEERSSKRRRE